MLWIGICVMIVILDQLTKFWVINSISIGRSVSVVDGFFSLTYIHNNGAAFGLFQNQVIIFIPLTIIILSAIIYFIYYSRNWLYSLSLTLILGGALGNFMDRIFRNGAVVDFLDFKFGSYNFYIFNVADSFVVVGTSLLAYYLLFLYDNRKIFSKYKI